MHFYITWDPKFPNGCRLYRFKSKTYPSFTVWEATGARCEHYVRKDKESDSKKGN